MAVQRDFPSIYTILKSEEEKGGVGGGGGGWLSERGRIFKENIPGND